jgi:peroxiredoxin
VRRTICFLGAVAVLSLFAGSAPGAEDNPVASAATEAKPLKAGESIPDVSLASASGESVQLSSFHQDGPLVIVFFRGSWCPICTRHFQDLIKLHPEIVSQGAKMVAISPDSVENTKDNTAKLKVPFPLLSDADVAAAKAFGLAFQVDEATIDKYRGFGIDLQKASGRDHHALPVPAIFIVDKAGKILFAHSNPDYTKRLDAKTIVAELKKLK